MRYTQVPTQKGKENILIEGERKFGELQQTKFMFSYGLNCYSPKMHTFIEVQTLITQNVIAFEDSAFKEMINLK